MRVEMEGSGTEQDPYKIENINQFRVVRQNLDASYELVSDIDAKNTNQREFTPVGDRETPFTDTFDGNDHQIANLCIKQLDKEDVGLFGWIGEKGEVRNLRVTNATILGGRYVGGLVGKNFGEIESCCIQEGYLLGEGEVGGLVGQNRGRGKVESSCIQEAYISGERNVGGLVGSNYKGKVESSYTVKVDVSGGEHIGSLIGLGDSCRVGCFTASSTNEPDIPKEPDLIISRKDHRILYDVEKCTLFARVNDEIYSCENVSPIEMQSLAYETEVLKMTQKFMSSVVSARQG